MEELDPLFDPARPPLGHELFTDALVSAIEGGRVAHGWLLTGPQGVGKSATSHAQRGRLRWRKLAHR